MKFDKLMRSFFRKMVQMCSNFVTTCTIRGTRGAKLPADATFSESLEKSLDKVVSRGEKNFSIHHQYMNFLRTHKTALDKQLCKRSSGRSMVEMLGVLAIIGVLSVGALNGYSTAMMKYKLNKHASQISQLINTIHIYQYQLRYNNKSQFSLIPIFQKLNQIPEGMTVKNGDKDYLKDSFGTYNAIYINGQPYNNETILVIYGQPKYATPIKFQDTSVGIQYCRNVLENLQIVFKENKQNLCYIHIMESVGSNNILILNNQDFANMSITEISNLCSDIIEKYKQIFYHVCFRNTK